MQKHEKPSIWRYLIWGLVFGLIGSVILVKYFMVGDISKYTFFKQVFGNSFNYEVIDKYGNTAIREYYDYILELLQLLLVGIILGLAVGISNHSFRKTIFSILGGLTAGCLVIYSYSDLVSKPYFFSEIPRLLFWYAAAITIFLAGIDIKKREDFMWTIGVTALSIGLSFLVTVLISGLDSFASFMTVGLAFGGSKSTYMPQILVYIFAITLLTITINLGQWKKFGKQD